MRINIVCPENILHLSAEYIYADCPLVNFNPLAVRRRTIHSGNYEHWREMIKATDLYAEKSSCRL